MKIVAKKCLMRHSYNFGLQQQIIFEPNKTLVMKNVMCVLFVCLFAFAGYAQSPSWVNFEIKTTPDKIPAIIEAFTVFYATETGKKTPMAVLTENTLGDQEQCTHHMSFLSNDYSAISSMLSPTVWETNADWMQLGEAMGAIGVMPTLAFSGAPIVQSQAYPDAQHGIQVIWALDVQSFNDQESVVTGFATFVQQMQSYFDNTKMELSLHQHMAGDNRSIDYWILASHKDYAEYMQTMADMSTNENFLALMKAFGDAQNPMTIMRSVLKVWNAPTSMD